MPAEHGRYRFLMNILAVVLATSLANLLALFLFGDQLSERLPWLFASEYALSNMFFLESAIFAGLGAYYLGGFAETGALLRTNLNPEALRRHAELRRKAREHQIKTGVRLMITAALLFLLSVLTALWVS